MKTYNWGFLGTGNIARSMASALDHVPGAKRLAAASRSDETARQFASAQGFERAYGSYDALLADPDVDIVYVATPNALHRDNILAALNAGKHVLCEKPMTLSADDSAACFDAAEKAGLCLMEALWTAFFPAMQKAIALIQSGEIGKPRHVTANFVSLRRPEADPTLFDPTLGGGARNDLGIYPLAAALLLAGPVARSSAHMIIGPTGVDEMAAFTLEHENGALSLLSCGFRAEMPVAVRCVGETGSVEIASDFHHPDHVKLIRHGQEQVFSLPYLGNGYAHEAIVFQDCLNGKQSAWSRAQTEACAALMAATST